MAKFMWTISVSFAVKANHTISYARNTEPHFGWITEVPLCIKCFPILVDCILTRGRHSHIIPLVMAWPRSKWGQVSRGAWDKGQLVRRHFPTR